MSLIPAAVRAWSGVELRAPLSGGARNQVFLADRRGRRVVVRRSARPVPALEWELDLLDHLRGNGIGVPGVLPADDGRRHVGGVTVHPFVDGRPPATPADWSLVTEALSAVHELTRDWPQRPGFASSRTLLTADRGGDVRLDAMTPAAVRAIRAAWRPVATGAGTHAATGGGMPLAAETGMCVNHGDVGAGNIRLDGAKVTLLDWDESRVDVPWFDFAFLPDAVPAPAPIDRYTLVTAGVAWEAATCWMPEPAYAARRLAELYERTLGPGRPAG